MRSLREIKDYVSYDPTTGVFTWIKRPRFASAVVVGARGGKLAKSGYRFLKFGSTEYRCANLAWFYVNGALPPDGLSVDHISGDRDDDRISNLRLATITQNMANRAGHKDSLSRYKGVTFDKKTGRWQASMKANGKQTYLGQWDDENDAALAYDEAAFAMFGEFARLNIPEARA